VEREPRKPELVTSPRARAHDGAPSRIAAALIGAPIATVALCLAVGAWFSPASGKGLALVEVFAYPLTVVAACVVLVRPDGRRAWLACVCAVLLAAGILGLERLVR